MIIMKAETLWFAELAAMCIPKVGKTWDQHNEKYDRDPWRQLVGWNKDQARPDLATFIAVLCTSKC